MPSTMTSKIVRRKRHAVPDRDTQSLTDPISLCFCETLLMVTCAIRSDVSLLPSWHSGVQLGAASWLPPGGWVTSLEPVKHLVQVWALTPGWCGASASDPLPPDCCRVAPVRRGPGPRPGGPASTAAPRHSSGRQCWFQGPVLASGYLHSILGRTPTWCHSSVRTTPIRSNGLPSAALGASTVRPLAIKQQFCWNLVCCRANAIPTEEWSLQTVSGVRRSSLAAGAHYCSLSH